MAFPALLTPATLFKEWRESFNLVITESIALDARITINTDDLDIVETWISNLSLVDNQADSVFGLGNGVLASVLGSADDLIAIGSGALGSATSASKSIGLGENALGSLTTGNRDIAVGTGAGAALTTENNNSLFGVEAGSGLTGSNNILWGYQAGADLVSDNFQFRLGVGIGNSLLSGNLQSGSLGLTVHGLLTAVGNFTAETNIKLNGDIILNENTTGSPSSNAIISVERGSSANAEILWNETSNRWQFSNDGSSWYNFALPTETTDPTIEITGTQSITGGGDLTADRSLNLVNDQASPIALNYYGTDGSGVKGFHPLSLGTGGGITAFGFKDADSTVVSMVESSTLQFVETPGLDINFTGTPAGTPGDPFQLEFTVDHDLISNFVSAEHINHNSVSITGANSIIGGGDITTSRTLDLVGDTAAPGNNFFYGTDGSGTKGWFAFGTSGLTVFSVIDGDSTTKSISDDQYIKFAEGNGINANFGPGIGTSGDPYNMELSLKALDANWDAGSFQVRSKTFRSDATTGTAPLVVASTTKVTNLNADLLDGLSSSAFASSSHNHNASNINAGVLNSNRLPDLTVSDFGASSHLIAADTWVSNDSQFVTSAAMDDRFALESTLATVATSGAYSDLTGSPALATVATSGAYSDLTGSPTIPAAYLDWNLRTNGTFRKNVVSNSNVDFVGGADISVSYAADVVTIASTYSHPTYNGDDFSIDSGALTGATVISDLDVNITTNSTGHVTDANATIATRTLTLANLGYTGATNATNNAGTVTNVTVGTGLDITGASTTPAITLDLTELPDGTGAIVGTVDQIIYLDNGTQKRKQVSEWTLSDFDNDLGWTSNSGDITNVTAGSNLTGGGASGSVTLNLSSALAVTSITCTSDGTFNTSSDRNLKYNISPITGALDKIEALGGDSFFYIGEDGAWTGLNYGFIAQKMQNALPELVVTGDNGMLKIRNGGFEVEALLAQGIIELREEIRELKALLGAQ